MKNLQRITPAQIIIFGFLGLIGLGTLLLMLPFATRSGQGASFADAVFTATSATCVTGLVVRDTWGYWSAFGQLIILCLIQVGGMGVVTMALSISIVTRKKIGLRFRVLMRESIAAPQMGGVVRLTGFILKTTACIEGAGAVLLAFWFVPRYDLPRGLWYAVFHSVSAFCNAGFDLMGRNGRQFASFTGVPGSPLPNLVLMALIILGGLGFFTWEDLALNGLHARRYRLQTKLILCATALLLVLPAIYLYLYELGLPVWAGLSGGERFWGALFQSVTLRTAGFNTLDFAAMSGPTIAIMIFLMLVGGAPSSTAGGMKVTTLAALVINIKAAFQNRERLQVFGRRLPAHAVSSALALVTLYVCLFTTSGVLISIWEGAPIAAALFETASAVGTVGVSMGLTPTLGAASRALLILLMYFGRVGGLTLILAVNSGHTPPPSAFPQENVTIG